MCIGPKTFVWGERTYVMGVINVSPESFSGDGVADADAAIARARQLVDEGADMLDVGGRGRTVTLYAAERSRPPTNQRSNVRVSDSSRSQASGLWRVS